MERDRVYTSDLYLFAVNTGEWYAMHCRLAKIGAGSEPWVKHVRETVAPGYIKAFPYTANYAFPVFSAALELREYYMRHIKDGASHE